MHIFSIANAMKMSNAILPVIIPDTNIPSMWTVVGSTGSTGGTLDGFAAIRWSCIACCNLKITRNRNKITKTVACFIDLWRNHIPVSKFLLLDFLLQDGTNWYRAFGVITIFCMVFAMLNEFSANRTITFGFLLAQFRVSKYDFHLLARRLQAAIGVSALACVCQ